MSILNGLDLVTYNSDQLKIPNENQLNIFMGIGLWSLKHGLSTGLPVDVMQMLLTVTLLRRKIREANPGKPSKVILLIADSMAVGEGAASEKVAQLLAIYKRSLIPLLELLHLREESEIVLSSELEISEEYQGTLQAVEKAPLAQQLQKEDVLHYSYVRTQTAHVSYMSTHRGVGIKVGWVGANSITPLTLKTQPKDLERWDEFKFDRLCEAICPTLSIQFLYAKAGMRHSEMHQGIQVSERPPYLGYAKDYLVQTEVEKEIKTICPLQRSVVAHWKGIAELCALLIQAKLVSDALLPKGCIRPNNVVATVYKMLNHWVNAPKLKEKES